MKSVPFSEAFRDITSKYFKIPKSKFLESGSFPIIDQGRGKIAGHFDDVASAVDSGEVVIFGDHTRAVKFADGPFALGADGTKVLKPVFGLFPRYAYRWLEAQEVTSLGYSRHFKLLKELSVPVCDEEEQRRIAVILDKADALRSKRRESIGHLDALGQSIFEELISNVEMIDWAKVEDAGKVQLGRQRAPKYQTGQHTRPYMRVANVQLDSLDLNDVLSMDFDEKDFDSYKLNVGDILLNEGQSTELVGRPAMWRNEIADCCFQNTLVRFVPDTKIITPEYALAVFLMYFNDGEFSKISSKTSNVAHLGAGRFAKMRFPIIPLRLQQKFSDRMAVLERQKSKHRAQLAEFDELFLSLQDRAFKGELL